jgi:hypothetical protein
MDGPKGKLEQEAAVIMLSGLITHSALMHGTLPTDDLIVTAVELILKALKTERPKGDNHRQ